MIADLEQRSKNITAETLLKLSVSQYHRMIDYGIFAEDSQIELLEGLLTAKMPKNPPHRLSTGLLQDLLLSLLPANYHLNIQEPITLLDSEPEPDLAVVIGKRQDYRDRHPFAQDIELVIEVADSSLERDRTIKQRIYAMAGISTYWILNLSDRTLEVYTQPSDQGRYQDCQVLPESESVVLTINQIAIASFKVGLVL